MFLFLKWTLVQKNFKWYTGFKQRQQSLMSDIRDKRSLIDCMFDLVVPRLPPAGILTFHLLCFSSSPQQEDSPPPPPAPRLTVWWPPAPLRWANGSPPPTRPCPWKRWWTSTCPQAWRGQAGRRGSRASSREWVTTRQSASARRTPCRPRRAPAQGTSARRRPKVSGAASRSRDSSHRVDTLFTSYPPPIPCCVSTPCACAGWCQSVCVFGFPIQLVSTAKACLCVTVFIYSVFLYSVCVTSI